MFWDILEGDRFINWCENVQGQRSLFQDVKHNLLSLQVLLAVVLLSVQPPSPQERFSLYSWAILTMQLPSSGLAQSANGSHLTSMSLSVFIYRKN